MRHPVNSMVAQLRDKTAAAREARAAELYGYEPLRVAMLAAAKAGFDVAMIAGPDGLDLRETEAAKIAEKWLINEKVSARWVHRDGAAGLEAASAYDLVLSWKTAAEK